MKQSDQESLSSLKRRRNFARLSAVLLLAPTIYCAAKTGVEFINADHAPTAAASEEAHNAAMGDLPSTLIFAAAEIAIVAAACGQGEAIRRRENGE